MKNKNFNKIFSVALLLGMLLTGLVSCEKFNDWDVDSSHSRLFSPTSGSNTIDGVTASITWKNVAGANAYEIQVSKDSLLFTHIIDTFKVTGLKPDVDGNVTFTIPRLLDQVTLYSARMRAIDTTGKVASSKWIVTTFKTKSEQLFIAPIADSDITKSSVVLRWQAPNNVSHIMLGATRYDITPTESAAGVKTITGLSIKTNYTATLYYNTTVRGTVSFATKADIPVGPNVIYMAANGSLSDTIAALPAGSNKIIVMLQGTSYKIDATAVIPDGVSVTIWGEDGANKPIIYTTITGGGVKLFQLPAANGGVIKFENIDFNGLLNNDPTSTNQAVTSIIEQSSVANVNKVIFQSCIMRNIKRSAIRLSGASSAIDSMIVNNCLITNSTGGDTYGLIYISATSTVANHILLKNSTMYNTTAAGSAKDVICHDKISNQSTDIINCTFYNIGSSSGLVSFGTATAPAIPPATALNITNTVIAKPSGKGVVNTGTGASNTATNSYLVENNFSSNAVASLTTNSSTTLSTASTSVFVDLANGDFHFKTGAPISNVGDPRWFQ